jgi:asparagine synthase (glutamine-hydrolysing)
VCGIAGVWQRGVSREAWEPLLQSMGDALFHRGPDDGGTWHDGQAGIGVVNRRLAIIDVSPLGHQPMASASERFVIAYNGELYNFQELREELEQLGHRFRGHSDTEVLLATIDQWGVHAALTRLNGMFAFALWDRERRCLHLVRDRVGEKPLYYGWVRRAFVFASELKAIRTHPEFSADVDPHALALFLRHSYVPAPYSIYRGIAKLAPGSILTLDQQALGAGQTPEPAPFWSAREAAEAGLRDPFRGSEADAVEQLDDLLRDAVRRRMVADVPLGAFLSGGVDSSTVVAMMQAHSSRPVKTFSIGFHEAGYDEAAHARAVARHLGTDHTELYVTADQALAVIPRLPALYDEPFADSSQIPTLLVSELARRHVTVSLSGDGGDELFGGYNRYLLGRKIWDTIGWMPGPLRTAIGRGLTLLSPETWSALLGRVRGFPRVTQPGDKLHKLAEILDAPDADSLYLGLVSHWRQPAQVVEGATELPSSLTSRWPGTSVSDFTARMMYLDLVTYLPDDILVKLDRASMGVSLEARVPMLDHRVIELAWRLPLSMKVAGDTGKLVLRRVLDRYVPRPLIDRPKMGFGVPIDAWLRGPLREWAESLLDERRLGKEGFFRPEPIRARWREHLSGRRNWQYLLWDVLMFQAWLDR